MSQKDLEDVAGGLSPTISLPPGLELYEDNNGHFRIRSYALPTIIPADDEDPL